MADPIRRTTLLTCAAALVLVASLSACENTESLLEPSPENGTVLIDASPDGIDPPWTLRLPDSTEITGNGDASLKNQVPGNYVLTWQEVEGYGTPASSSASLEGGGSARFSGTYIARALPTGTAVIDIQPDELNAGWYLADTDTIRYAGFGDSTLAKVTIGDYQVLWEPIEAWAPPSPNPMDVVVEQNAQITIQGVYTPLDTLELGTIVINPLPEAANAPWTLSGPNGFGAAGSGAKTFPGRATGNYTITWRGVFGYATPEGSSGFLAADDSLNFEATYVPATATLTVDPNPDHLNAPWTLTSDSGTSVNGNGDRTLSDIAAGGYTIQWRSVDGWDTPTPESQTVDLQIDDQKTVSGTYTEVQVVQHGTVEIAVSPQEGAWSLIGPGTVTSGTGSAVFREMEPGQYDLQWQDIDGWITPQPASVSLSLTANSTITFDGVYSNPDAPSLESFSGTPSNGNLITLSGTNMGVHSLDLSSAVGPNGWIERNSPGTTMDALVGAEGWFEGFSSGSLPAAIDNSRVRSGQHSINASVDHNNTSWQRPVAFHKPETFDSVYVSWWVYFDPQVWSTNSQWKIWYISPYNHHARCASITNISRWNVNTNSPYHYRSTPEGCLGIGGGGVCAENVQPVPSYELPFDDPSLYLNHNHGQSESYSRNLPTMGSWARWEIYAKRSRVDAYDGQLELYITKDGERRHIDTLTGLQTHNSSCNDGVSPPAEPWEYFGLHGMWDDGPKDVDGDGTIDPGSAIPNDAARIFYDDVYIQFGTRARVELGDQPVYESCSQLEVQTPVDWSADSIPFELNHGGFSPGDRVYLFVVRQDGVASSGLPITLQ